MTDRSTLDLMIQFEQGDLSDEAIIDLFQELINTGLAWSLQGSYGRMAHNLIDAGLCDPAPEPEYPETEDDFAREHERYGGSHTYDPHAGT